MNQWSCAYLARMTSTVALATVAGCSDDLVLLRSTIALGVLLALLAALGLAHLLFRRRWNKFVFFARRVAESEDLSLVTTKDVPTEFLMLWGTLRRLHAEANQERSRFESLFRNMPAGYALHQAVLDNTGRMYDYRFLLVNPAFEAQTGLSASNIIGRTVRDVIPGIEEFFIERYRAVVETGEVAQFEHRAEALGRAYRVIAYRTRPGEFATIFADITEEVQAKERIERAMEALRVTLEATRAVQEKLEPEARAQEITRVCVEGLGAKYAWVGEVSDDGAVVNIAQCPEEAYPAFKGTRFSHTLTCPVTRAIASGKVVVEPVTEEASSSGCHLPDAPGLCVFPMAVEDRPHWVLCVYPNADRPLDDVQLSAIESLAHIGAVALVNARLYQDAKRRLELVTSLRTIDLAITGSLDPRVTLSVLLDQVTGHLDVDAAAVLRLDDVTLELRHAASRGFHTDVIEKTRVRLGEGYAGKAAHERKTVMCHDAAICPEFLRQELAIREGFVTYYAAPMVTKNRVVGVLETFHRRKNDPDGEWVSALEALATQAAIAIENSEMFADLERRNMELRLAYEATIEGWSRAMDLRDKETEGHTRRVTELTVQMARAMGLPEDRIVHIRRGALLHDIGKLGVPDHILLKTGPLTEEEWVIMRQHTTFAYEMLYPIEYLRPAIDIPYCHHERWDGKGYPRGLKGREIPLAARLFAPVDVWDAVTSDRPYRPAWPREKAIAALREGAGSHFDPEAVACLLQVLGET